MGKLQVRGAFPNRLRRNGVMVPKAYLGTTLVWDSATDSQTEGPKIDPSHPLAQRFTMRRLTLGALEGMVADTNYVVADNAFASKTAGTVSFLKEAFPTAPTRTLRISALVKVDKTAGRYSRVGFASNTTSPTTGTADIYVGHNAGTGIVMGSTNFAISIAVTLLTEAQLVDGAWYRVSLVWDNHVLDQAPTSDTTNTGPNRVTATVEPVDPANNPANPWYAPNQSAKHATTYTPMALVARTNSALGTVRDLTYVDSMLGVANDNAPIVNLARQGAGAVSTDTHYLYSKGKAAPLRVIVTAGGSGVYGGINGWGAANGRSGTPYDTWRKAWRDLADLGYTVLHTEALHEGWGADDHLAKQLEAYNRINAEFGGSARLYYLGYSMGGLSAWRAIRGRAGFPPIRAAYIVAGAIGLDRYYDNTSYAQIKTRWPDRGALDEPANFSGADLIARGTRVRLVTSTGDTNVPKVDNHDVMKAKYAGSSLFSELVHTGIGHFDPAYWSVPDITAFYEGQDLGT